MVALHRSLKSHSYPFRFLLYAGWTLSVICFSSTLIELLRENQLSIQSMLLMHTVAEMFVFGLTLLLVVKLTSIGLAQNQVEEQLAAVHQQLQQNARLVETLAAVKHRNCIAHTVHDALGHTLMAQNIQLQTAVKLWQRDPDKAKLFLEQAQQLAVEAIQEIRRSDSSISGRDARETQKDSGQPMH